MGVHHSKLKSHTKAWESAAPTPVATPKRGSSSAQLNGPHQDNGVHHPSSGGQQQIVVAQKWQLKGHTKPGGPPHRFRGRHKNEGAKAWIEGPHRSMDVHHPNSRGTSKCGSLSSPIHVPHQSMPVHQPNARGMPKHKSQSSELVGPHQSVREDHPKQRGHTKDWVCIPPICGVTTVRGSPSILLQKPA